jgi:glycine/D-amino acid oxidase-like deaminating enzyme
VTLVDAGGPASGTTGTTGAMVGSNEKQPAEYYRLGLLSMEAMERTRRELRGRRWFLPRGHIEWATTDRTRASLNARVARLREWDYPVETVSPRFVMKVLEPELRIPPSVDEVAFFTADSIIFPQTLIAFMLRELRSRNVELRFGGGSARIAASDGAVTGVVDGRGERISADTVVVCVGRWTQTLLAQVGFSLPLVDPYSATPESLGLQVITSGVPVDVRRMIRMPGLSIRPAGGGRLMLHGRPEEGDLHAEGRKSGLAWDTPLSPPPPQAHSLVAKAKEVLLNMQSVTVQSATASIRPLTADGLPAVGPVPGALNLYTAVAHSGVGLGPLLGELIAEELDEERENPLLTPFRPGRFSEDGWRQRPMPMREAQASNAPVN